VEVALRPTWANGKVWSHKTTLEDIQEEPVTNALAFNILFGIKFRNL
jgi:hypothetical protein